jgi:hypothetical protein
MLVSEFLLGISETLLCSMSALQVKIVPVLDVHQLLMLSAGTLTYSEPEMFTLIIFIICYNCYYYYYYYHLHHHYYYCALEQLKLHMFVQNYVLLFSKLVFDFLLSIPENFLCSVSAPQVKKCPSARSTAAAKVC